MPGCCNTAKRWVSVRSLGGLCLLLVSGLPRAAAKAVGWVPDMCWCVWGLETTSACQGWCAAPAQGLAALADLSHSCKSPWCHLPAAEVMVTLPGPC